MDEYQDIARALTARHLQTDYEALVSFDLSLPANMAHDVLEAGDFDFGPVTREGHLVGRLSRQVAAETPGALVGDLQSPLVQRHLITADSDVGRVMIWLAQDPWLFVIDGNEVTGIVTPSDLNRQAGRTYLYLLLTDFEERLAKAARALVGAKESLGLLNSRRRTQVRRLFDELKEGEIDVDVVAAMTFTDLVMVAAKSSDIRAQFGVASKSAWDNLTGSLIDLRNAVMHPSRPFLDDRSGLTQLVRDSEKLSLLITSDSGSGRPT